MQAFAPLRYSASVDDRTTRRNVSTAHGQAAPAHKLIQPVVDLASAVSASAASDAISNVGPTTHACNYKLIADPLLKPHNSLQQQLTLIMILRRHMIRSFSGDALTVHTPTQLPIDYPTKLDTAQENPIEMP